MTAPISDILNKLIQTYGKELCLDKRRCKAILADYMGQINRSQLRYLLRSLDNGLTDAMLKEKSKTLPIYFNKNWINTLIKNGFSEENAKWVILSWANALDLNLPIATETNSVLHPPLVVKEDVVNPKVTHSLSTQWPKILIITSLILTGMLIAFFKYQESEDQRKKLVLAQQALVEKTKQIEAEKQKILAQQKSLQEEKLRLATEKKRVEHQRKEEEQKRQSESLALNKTEIQNVVYNYIKAWEKMDINQMMANCSGDFTGGDGRSYYPFSQQRQKEFGWTAYHTITISEPHVELSNTSSAQVYYTQTYDGTYTGHFQQEFGQSGYRSVLRVTLTLSQQNGHWLIIREKYQA